MPYWPGLVLGEIQSFRQCITTIDGDIPYGQDNRREEVAIGVDVCGREPGDGPPFMTSWPAS